MLQMWSCEQKLTFSDSEVIEADISWLKTEIRANKSIAKDLASPSLVFSQRIIMQHFEMMNGCCES